MIVRGILGGMCLHGADHIGKPSKGDAKVMQNIIIRAIEKRSCEKYWEREYRHKLEEQGVRPVRRFVSVLAKSPWELEAEPGLETLDNVKLPLLNRDMCKQAINSMYKSFRYRAVETVWEEMSGSIWLSHEDLRLTFEMPDIFKYNRLFEEFESRKKFLPNRVSNFWTKDESLEYNANKCKAELIRQLVDTSILEVILRRPSQKAKNFIIDPDQWPFHSFREFNELPLRVRSDFVHPYFVDSIKSYINTQHRHHAHSSWCARCVRPDIFRYRTVSAWTGKRGIGATKHDRRSEKDFLRKKVQIKMMMQFENEISQDYDNNFAFRQAKILGTICSRGQFKEFWMFKSIFTKIRKIAKEPCLVIDNKSWVQMIRGDVDEWVKWNSNVRRLIFGEKFGPDNLSRNISGDTGALWSNCKFSRLDT